MIRLYASLLNRAGKDSLVLSTNVVPMPGLMAFHAHPDDEVIQTGGVLSKAVEAGEHVVVVTATDGAEGEVHNYDARTS